MTIGKCTDCEVFITQVKDTYESHDFLGVSMGSILKIKTGSLTPDGPTEHMLTKSQGRAPSTVQIMLQITRENVRKDVVLSLVAEIDLEDLDFNCDAKL